ncbi:hypothetical protein JCM3766R1_003260 [Sporobolomyces carnicolor]
MSRVSSDSCDCCAASSTPCDLLLPCTACISTAQACTYSHRSPRSTLASAFRDLPRSSVQRWSEHPRLSRGSIGGGRLKAVRNERGEIDEFEWETLVQQKQELRLVSPETTKTRRLASPTILLANESEHVDLVGDPIPFSSDAQLLSGLHSVLPDNPLHPTIFLNAHLAAHPPPTKSRIAAEFEPSNLNRGNCVASAPIISQSRGAQVVVWRTGDERFKRPTSVGWGILGTSLRSSGSRGWKRSGISQDVAQDEDQMDLDSQDPGKGTGHQKFERFRAGRTPIFAHHTPIHQLEMAALPPTPGSVSPTFLLGARSHTSVNLVTFALPTPFDPVKPPSILLSQSYSIPRSTIADLALGGVCRGYGQAGQGLIVDEGGSLFGFDSTAAATDQNLYQLRNGLKRHDRGYSGFARVEYGGGGGLSNDNLQAQAIVGLEDRVLLYDLRSPTSQLGLLGSETLSRYPPYGSARPALVTSLLSRSASPPDGRNTDAGPANSWMHTVCTTRDVIWLDQRMAGGRAGEAEVLRWEHERVGIEGKGVDRTLTITELPRLSEDSTALSGEQVQRVAVSSRLNSNVSIFTAGLDPVKAPRSLLDPYDLPSPRATRSEAARFRRVGFSFSVRDERDRSEEEEEGPSDTLEPLHAPAARDDATAAASRRELFLKRMAKEAEAEEREKRKPTKLTVLEVEMDGGLFEGLVTANADVTDGSDNACDSDVDAVDLGRVLQDEPRIETVRLDMTAAIATMGGEALIGEGIRQARSTTVDVAVGLLKKSVEEAREIEGDVGALTALEVLHLARAIEPEAAAKSDSEEEEPQDAQRESRDFASTDSIEPLPRSSAFVAPRDVSLLSASSQNHFSFLDSLITSLSTSAATSFNPFNASPNSRFNIFSPFPFSLQQTQVSERAQHLRRTFNIAESDSPASLACDRLAGELSLSSCILLPRTIEPDEPTDTPNQPQPASEEPPPLHLAYVRPIVSDQVDADSDEYDPDNPPSFSYRDRRRKKKPTLNARGARLLLAEWHIGADPRSYAWSNPYEGEKDKDEPYSQYSQSQSQSQRKKAARDRKKRNAGQDESSMSSQPQVPTLSQSRFEFPSSFPPSSSQSYFPSLGGPPALNVVSEEGPPSSSQGWPGAQTQPIISVSGPVASSPRGGSGLFGGANSQVVPGAFGSRLGVANGARTREKEKKKTKKRVSGF